MLHGGCRAEIIEALLGFHGLVLANRGHLYRFIRTAIISGAALEKLQSHKIPFAEVEDAAAAVLHLASDKTLNGELCAVLQRAMMWKLTRSPQAAL